MKATINRREYRFEKSYQHDPVLRQRFDALAQLSFDGLSLERWYQNGCWTKDSVPYTLFDGERAVSNILIHRMDFLLRGSSPCCFVQLGTVMTHPDYRKLGLLRFLMEQVLRDWKDTCDGLFLYANDSVLDFYPRFGFVPSLEWEYRKSIVPKLGKVRKLDLQKPEDRAFLLRKAQRLNPFSALALTGSTSTIQFHCDYFLSDGVYCLEDFDAVAIAERDGENLICYDVFCESGSSLDEILAVLAGPETTSVTLGFAPKDTDGFKIVPVAEGDRPFVLSKGQGGLFDGQKLRFPLLSHT